MLATCPSRIGREIRTDDAVVAALRTLAHGTGEVVMHAQRTWRSVTFSGSRHTLTIAFDGDAAVAGAEQLIEALPDHRWKIPGHLMADAAIASMTQRADPPHLVMEVELLLLEDA